MIKYGIVSSFDTLCGNATYSEEIAKGLSKKFIVVKIDIPISLQKRYSEEVVSDIINQIHECDFINIQMELGLYGPDPFVSLKVLKKIISSSKAFNITMHRINPMPGSILRLLYNQIKNFGFSSLYHFFSTKYIDYKLSSIYKELIVYIINKKGTFIVHTNREYKLIKRINTNSKVRVHPITWPDNNIPEIDLNKYFNTKNTIVGLFGFISEYKNYLVVINGLKFEPVNLFIAGGTHPQSPHYGKVSGASTSYIRFVSNHLADKKWRGRFHLENSPSDYALIQFIKSVDIVCVPYAETGQSGSGIASLAIQFGKRVIFSDTHCTSELKMFLKGDLTLSDVDSPVGFASALKSVLLKNTTVSFDNYDFDSMLEIYKP